MKKLIVAWVVLMLVGVMTTARAQENVLKINIFSPIVKTFNMSYERKVSATGSFQLGAFYTGFTSGDTEFKGFGITPEYRFICLKRKPRLGFMWLPLYGTWILI